MIRRPSSTVVAGAFNQDEMRRSRPPWTEGEAIRPLQAPASSLINMLRSADERNRGGFRDSVFEMAMSCVVPSKRSRIVRIDMWWQWPLAMSAPRSYR